VGEPSYEPLLAEDEPEPFELLSGHADSPYVITCDHAGRRIPRALGTLGLNEAELATHIAWDLGARATAGHMARALDAFLITQTYSRLVIDCNRPLGAPTSIVRESEMTRIPGNESVSVVEAERRAASIFRPYHECIVAELERRQQGGVRTVFIAFHSFTPTFKNTSRPWHVGILHQRDSRLARVLLELLGRDRALCVGDNQPYAVSDATDYGVVEYGEKRGHLHVELEIRQDLIADTAGQTYWGERMATLVREADARISQRSLSRTS
jgi:predicted N-formylglutamate amidohydrolase